MDTASTSPPSLPPRAYIPSERRNLRRLFLTLFLRGRTSRGLNKQGAPKSVGRKLGMAVLCCAAFGLFALWFRGQPVFALSFYLHGMTFVFLGLFVAGSAGEILFNKEEADILMHRPIQPQALLWAKIRVLVEVSLWLAAAFNATGFLIGLAAPDGGWGFPLVHAVSTLMEAMFCTGCVVMIDQYVLRWFGRVRLGGLVTTTQVFVSIAAVLASQIVPRLIGQFGTKLHFNMNSWWLGLLPTAWFAGLDDGVAGRATLGSWTLAGIGLAATAVVLWLAFGKLAHDYQTGLQTLTETLPRRRSGRSGRFWVNRLANIPPLCWWLRDPVARAGFLLTVAYLARDRDVKLRVYPGLAPMLVLPIIFLLPNRSVGGGGSFGIAFAGGYLGLLPVPCLNLVPLSMPIEEAKAAGRGLTMMGVMLVAMVLSGLAVWSWSAGWFGWLLSGEALLVIGLCASMTASLAKARWTPMD